MRQQLDDLIGRVTMYRLVTLCLVTLAAVSVLFGITGTIDSTIFEPGAMLLSLAVLLVASVVSSRVLGLLWRVRPHTESAVITALLLFFLFWPQSSVSTLAWLAAAAVLANVAKYVLAIRGRHLFNPAAIGAFLVLLAQMLVGVDPIDRIATTWWAASEPLLPFVVVLALLVLYRTRRLGLAAVFVVVAGGLVLAGLVDAGTPFGDAIELTAYSYPIVFLAGFMLTEPLTLPPRRVQQLVVAVVAAVVLAWPTFQMVLLTEPPDLGVFEPTPELALIVANLVAFCFGQRRGVRLDVTGRRQLASDTWEISFEPRRPVRFVPGQHLELHLPHRRADTRGVRRVFSISSAPADGSVTVAVRVPESSSSFKRALLEVGDGASVTATGVGGDFVWPSDASRPLLLVAGGIGVTPFLSQLRHHEGRDVVLVYGVTSAEDIAYADELAAAGVRVVLVSPSAPGVLPEGWTHRESPFITADVLAEAVPDLASRHAYVSGPPAMVNTVRRALRRRCASVRTDYFTGY